VLDADGRPVADASVSVEGTPARAVTGEDGRYVIANVPPGAHTLVARRLGYAPAELVVPATGEPRQTVQFTLRSSPVALSAVVVPGARGAARADSSLGERIGERVLRRAAPSRAMAESGLGLVERVAGCYALQLGPWRPARVPGVSPRATGVPTRIVLDAAHYVAREPFQSRGFVVRPQPGEPPSAYVHAFWEPAEGTADTVRIVWSTGYGGVELYLGAGGPASEMSPELRGSAATFDENGDPATVQRTTVVARRVSCPAP
jgi:Carboxypeptidase regulatory-like domain